MARKQKAAGDAGPNHSLVVDQTPDETGAQALARKLLQPEARHAHTASSFASKMLGTAIELPGLKDFSDHMKVALAKAESGDLSFASRLLAAQAITLDSMFTELARRSAVNMGEYMDASERYGRLAMKAQSNCRATLEALAKLHQPREQTVRHVHVNEGGQAVIADQFHNHTGGQRIAGNDEQSHATGGAGEGPALPSANPLGESVPIPGREGEAALQDARRDQFRTA